MMNMDTPIGADAGRADVPLMNEEQRTRQLIGRVFGNVHIEYPGVTREFVRQVVQERRAAGAIRGIVVR